MEKVTWDEACKEIADEIVNLLISKQRDYGKNNILDFGEYGILVRSNDKIARLKNLSQKDVNPANESIDDTWKDISGYAILALMLRRGLFSLPFESNHETAKLSDNLRRDK